MEAVRKSFSTEELVFASQMSLQESGNVAASNLLHEAAEITPKRLPKYHWLGKKKKLRGKQRCILMRK